MEYKSGNTSSPHQFFKIRNDEWIRGDGVIANDMVPQGPLQNKKKTKPYFPGKTRSLAQIQKFLYVFFLRGQFYTYWARLLYNLFLNQVVTTLSVSFPASTLWLSRAVIGRRRFIGWHSFRGLDRAANKTAVGSWNWQRTLVPPPIPVDPCYRAKF